MIPPRLHRNVTTTSQSQATSDEARWPSGILQFERVPLRTVMAEANRYSHQKLMLADAEAGRHLVSGACPASDVAGLARSVAAAFDLVVSTSSEGDIVLASRPPAR